jgi:hypothetical protein
VLPLRIRRASQHPRCWQELVSSLAPLGRKSCDFAADFGKLS